MRHVSGWLVMAFASPAPRSRRRSLRRPTSTSRRRCCRDLTPEYAHLGLPYGTYLTVHGRTAGCQWCDVSTGYDRGWVPGNYILYPYQGAPVLLPSYGPRVGIPIIASSIGTYWGAHYQRRAFYRDRDRWYGRPPPIARPPGYRPPSRIDHRPPSHRPPSRRRQPASACARAADATGATATVPHSSGSARRRAAVTGPGGQRRAGTRDDQTRAEAGAGRSRKQVQGPPEVVEQHLTGPAARCASSGGTP